MKSDEWSKLFLDLAGSQSSERPRKILPQVESLIIAAQAGNRTYSAFDLKLALKIANEIDSSTPKEAWRKVFNLDDVDVLKGADERDHMLEGVRRNLHTCTIAYFDMGKSEPKIASGTLVEIAGRVFVATTSHSIPKSKSEILFATADRGLAGSIEIVATGKVEGDRPDVAYIELRKDQVEDGLGKEAVGLDRIRIAGTGSTTHTTYVVGYPSANVTHKDERTVRWLLAQAIVYLNVLSQPEDWWDIPLSNDREHYPDPAFDLILPYVIGDDFAPHENDVVTELCEPYGLSGGGYWQSDIPPNELWHTESYRLIGIQVRWPRQGRYIQGTQITHWLKLVAERNPELSDVIRITHAEIDARKSDSLS